MPLVRMIQPLLVVRDLAVLLFPLFGVSQQFLRDFMSIFSVCKFKTVSLARRTDLNYLTRDRPELH
jgi:hypothetical protein